MTKPDDADSNREQRLNELIAEYHRRADGGECVDAAQLVAGEPDLADGFHQYLADVALIDELQNADRQTDATMSADADTAGSLANQETMPPSGLGGGEMDKPNIQVFGRYRIVRSLGVGGMGAVYLAEDPKLERWVALKIPNLRDKDDPQALARFYREARMAATLDHPNICSVFDIDEHDGIPFIAMAYIDGQPLSRLINGRNLRSQRAIAVLVRKVALALAEAHAQGVVHRDIKPSNILVDKRGEPIVTDFGLAHRAAKPDESRLTKSGMLLGTPAYMSPEQVEGKLDRIGPHSDIYSLGVVLYELLTGQCPFVGPVTAILGQILRDQPKPPSQIAPDVDKRLEAICLKMMAKDSQDRYPSAQQTAEALDVYLKETAAEESGVATTRNKPQRSASDRPRHRRRLLYGLLGVAAVLLSGIVVRVTTNNGTVQIEIPEDAENVTVRVDGESMAIAGLDHPIRLRVGPHQLEVESGNYRLFTTAFEIDRGENEPLKVELLPKNPQGVSAVVGAQAVPAELPSPENAAYSADLTALLEQARQSPDIERVFCGHTGPLRSIDFSPNGRYMVTAGEDATVRVWECQTGRELSKRTEHTGYVTYVRFLDEHRFLSASDDKRVLLWSVDSEVPVCTFAGHEEKIVSLAIAPDGRRFASCGLESKIRLWDIQSGEQSKEPVLPGYEGWWRNLAFLNDGQELMASRSGDDVVVFDVASGEVVRRFYVGEDWADLAISPDGSLALHAARRNVVLWDLTSGVQLWRRPTGLTYAHEVAFLPDGKRFASIQVGGTLELSDTATGEILHQFHVRCESLLACLGISHDGRFAASEGPGHGVVLWRLPPISNRSSDGSAAESQTAEKPATTFLAGAGSTQATEIPSRHFRTLSGHTQPIRSMDFSPNAGRIVTGSDDRTLRVWDMGTGQEVLRWNEPREPVTQVRFLPDGQHIVFATGDGRLSLWDLNARGEVRPLEAQSAELTSLAVLDQGRRIACCGPQEAVRLWAVEDGQEPRELVVPEHQGGWSHLAAASDANTLLAVTKDGRDVVVWDLTSGDVLRRFAVEQSPRSIAVTPDGLSLLVAHADSVSLWDVASGTPRWQQPIYFAKGGLVRCSADGKRFLLATQDGTLTLLATADGRLIDQYAGRCETAQATAALSSDGRLAASPGPDHTLLVWRLPPAATAVESPEGDTVEDTRALEPPVPVGIPVLQDGQSARGVLRVLLGHTEKVRGTDFSPDGLRLISASEDDTVRVWDIASANTVAVLTGHEENATGVKFLPDGRRAVSSSDDDTLILWDLDSRKPLHRFVGHLGDLGDLEVSADGRRLYSGGVDATVRIWDLETGRQLRQLQSQGFSRAWQALGLTGDQRWLLGAMNGVYDVACWDIAAGTVAWRLNAARKWNRVAVSPDGRWAGCLNRFRTSVWNIDHRQRLWEQQLGIAYGTDVCFSPDGQRLVVLSRDGTLTVVDTETRFVHRRLHGRQDIVWTVLSISPDGRLAASSGPENSVIVWRLGGEEIPASRAPTEVP